MAQYSFLDSSAILKRYLAEQGSRFIGELLNEPEAEFYIAQIAAVEVASALTRQAINKQISKRRAQTAISQFRSDRTSVYRVVAITDALIEYAMQLAGTHALRAYDAVQLATVLTIARHVTGLTVTFVCADEPLNKVAHSEGLPVENPNHHS